MQSTKSVAYFQACRKWNARLSNACCMNDCCTIPSNVAGLYQNAFRYAWITFSMSALLLPAGLPLQALSVSPILYTCIGAKLRILLQYFALNSWPTTLVNLVPIGSPVLLIKTHALSANLTALPSGRWHIWAVRTTTACLISPRFTLFAALTDTDLESAPKFLCFWTTTIILSPVVSC